ncbi:bacterial transferase hexapeptide repeat protein [Turicibacter sp. HGF1]|uniref:acyltransferase n=1 Tax=Turicibacter sp. HGF1 TaxID=910310 RepID=UPI0001FD88E5|nr:acyltransferase [Turicibacter sp. HGF1]EGC90822.1 bacterial transferase hexapeptide repeat protein [Turicibacter sp. HGF1]
MIIKNFLKKIIYREKYDSKSYVEYMKKLGAKIGDGTTIFSPTRTLIDLTRPWLLEIGENVQITEGVTILTHGYDWSVIKGVYGDVLGSSGRVKIGNNVFIGVNTTILKGTNIGNNVIIGANSLVNRNIPDNVVVAGNPCRIIMTLEEYYKKRKKAQLEEVTELITLYRDRYNKEPSDKELHEFFMLFEDNPYTLCDTFECMMYLLGNYNMSCSSLRNNKKIFDNKEALLKSIK